MQDSHNAIIVDHQDNLATIFGQIHFLIDNGRLEEAQTILLELHYADLSDFLDNATHLYELILPAIGLKLNPEFIVFVHDSNKQSALEAIGLDYSAHLINQLEIGDAIEVIETLDQTLKTSLLNKLDPDKKQQILEGFTYPDNTAGRVLEKNFVSFQEHWTVGNAIDYIRRSDVNKDFHACIIVNSKYRPVGNILLSTLLKSERNTALSELMNSDFKITDANTKLDELVFIFKQYALTIVPVVNKQGKLIGTISIDNMIYIIGEQTENEFMHLGGINTSDIFDNLYATAKHRFPWLFVNLITACVTSIVINQFSDTIAKLITLATIMPIVASMGGNAGTQATTVIVRALANREITQANSFKIVSKEIFVCALNGLILGAISVLVVYLLFFNMALSLVFAASVIINFAAAGLLGSGIPILLNNFDIDPAAASAVFVTAITDALGFFTFLGLAYFFLV